MVDLFSYSDSLLFEFDGAFRPVTSRPSSGVVNFRTDRLPAGSLYLGRAVEKLRGSLVLSLIDVCFGRLPLKVIAAVPVFNVLARRPTMKRLIGVFGDSPLVSVLPMDTVDTSPVGFLGTINRLDSSHLFLFLL